MLQALAALLGAAATVAACYALGALLIDRIGARLYSAERFPLAFLTGAACLHLAIFAILTLHIGYWPVIVAVLAAAVGAAVVKGSWRIQGETLPPLSKTLRVFSGALFSVYFVLYFFHAWAPESSPDGSGYHLALVARYLRDRGFERITTNFYSSFSQGVEMLFVPAFAIGRHSAAALVHFAFCVVLALSLLAYGRRLGKPWVGMAAAFLTLASPVVGIDGTSAYNDVALAAVIFGAFYWLQVWDETHDALLLIPVGLLSGYAYAVKYSGFAFFAVAAVFVAYRVRQLKPLILLTACSIAMVAPWMIKDWIEVQDPVAPFASQIFRNPYMHIADEMDLARQFSRYGVANKWTLPLEVTLRGQKTGGLLGPIFLGVPLALLALRDRAGRRLLAAGLVVLAPYFANVGTRFLIPPLPFLSFAMLLPLANLPPLLALAMLFHAVTSWPPIIEKYAPAVWRLDKVRYREALRIIPQDKYLRENDPAYGVARMVDQFVPAGERVLAPNGIADSYTSREILVTFRSAWTQVMGDAIDAGWDPGRQPKVMETFSFPERTVRRLRVLQIEGKSPEPQDEWSVNELRYFDRGAEVQRRPEWRLRAWPNPWEVQLAFDGSSATRWRTWAPIEPGDYLDTDFGKPQAVDQVHVAMSYDIYRVKLVIEAMDESGKWVRIAQDPAITVIPPELDVRYQATDFVKSQGIHYLLIQDFDWEAADIQGDPEGWGLTKIATGYGASIYKVN